MDTFKIEQYDDTKDLYITIPHYILQELNWQAGTEIEWKVKGDSIIIQDATKSGQEPEITRHSTKDFLKTKGKWF
jgi:antitoxin component of MazEF toxin-antitoxin module|tara:strand:+ start:1556 stop:1780 length:225 start_codon:yes stop_codon:yes gene_type:complete